MVVKITNSFIQFSLILFSVTVNAVPPDYCLRKLNTSDCHGTPTPVFSYYKPGSRCEIEIWRGCPTYNKFDNEYLCSHYCIFNFIPTKLPSTTGVTFGPEQCTHSITENSCKDGPQNIVFTFNKEKQECVPITWGECKAPNIFKDKETCISTCAMDSLEELKKLTDAEFKELEELLENYFSEKPTPSNKPLKVSETVEVTGTSQITPLKTEQIEVETTNAETTKQSDDEDLVTKISNNEVQQTTQSDGVQPTTTSDDDQQTTKPDDDIQTTNSKIEKLVFSQSNVDIKPTTKFINVTTKTPTTSARHGTGDLVQLPD